MRRGVSGKGGRASWWWGLARVGAGCVLVGMGCVQINGEDGDGWAYGCSGVAASQGVAERHQILRRFLFRGHLFFLGLPLILIIHLARTALCRRRTNRELNLASARLMVTTVPARARAAAAMVHVVGRSLALPILVAPSAALCFGCHQDDVVEWLQCVCGPRTPDIRRICAHRERQQ